MGKNRKTKSKKTATANSNTFSAGIGSAVEKGSIAIDDTVVSLSKNLLRKSISNSEMIPQANVPGAALKEIGSRKKRTALFEEGCEVVLVKGDTLEGLKCAWQLSDHSDPAVLVFASDTNPGGSTKSSNLGTQEEALCRTTTLRLAQVNLSYPIPTKGVAYVPHVQALCNNGTNNQAPTFAAICGALRSCVSGPSPSGKETLFLTEKICGVLDQACIRGHTTIVLGAWGCGAFGNPVEWIAQTFRECLGMERYRGCLLRVVFAIPNKSMMRAFEKVFGVVAAE